MHIKLFRSYSNVESHPQHQFPKRRQLKFSISYTRPPNRQLDEKFHEDINARFMDASEGGITLAIKQPDAKTRERVKSVEDIKAEREIKNLIQAITKKNAKEILEALKQFPQKYSTFEGRVRCMSMDSTILSYDALTNYTAQELVELNELKVRDYEDFTIKLVNSDKWIYEVQNMHAVIVANANTHWAARLAWDNEEMDIAQFRNITLHPTREATPKLPVLLTRGAPCSGKSTYIEKNFLPFPAADLVKKWIAVRLPYSVTSNQLHVHSNALAEKLLRMKMQVRYQQTIPTDALHISPEFISNKIAHARETDQRVIVQDMHVNLLTLAMRMLKRSDEDNRMGYAQLVNMHRDSIAKRTACIELAINNRDIVDYTVNTWSGSQYVPITQLSQDGMQIVNQEHYNGYIAAISQPNLDKECEEVRTTQITEQFIAEFVASIPQPEAQAFCKALEPYRGKTVEAALDAHADKIASLSPKASMVQGTYKS